MKSKKVLAYLLTISMVASIALVGCGKEKAKEPAVDGDTDGAAKVDGKKWMLTNI